ncbi:hypothetical protein, partial [Chryseobacterium sediminis]|uniref:hypothetical protein n=1 Tax=Chryseobacterium sediminis TaxID=1679494 RepID=UPI001E5E0C75
MTYYLLLIAYCLLLIAYILGCACFGVVWHWVYNKKNPLSFDKGFFKNKIKTGGGLLSRFRSTIGAGGLNFCV